MPSYPFWEFSYLVQYRQVYLWMSVEHWAKFIYWGFFSSSSRHPMRATMQFYWRRDFSISRSYTDSFVAPFAEEKPCPWQCGALCWCRPGDCRDQSPAWLLRQRKFAGECHILANYALSVYGLNKSSISEHLNGEQCFQLKKALNLEPVLYWWISMKS